MPSDPQLSCPDIVDAVLDEGPVVSLALRSHVERCLGCRHDLRSQRIVIETLRSLRTAPLSAPDDLLATIQAEVARVSARPTTRLARAARVAPYVGVVAATAAGAVLAGRRRTRFAV